MTRTMKAESTESFRVILEHLHADGVGAYCTYVLGPYATINVARGIATQAMGTATRDGRKARYRIQRTTTDWQDVE